MPPRLGATHPALASALKEGVRGYLPKQDPIGKRTLVQQIIPGKAQLGREIPWEVIGVIADERISASNNKQDTPAIYATNEQRPVYISAT